MTGAEMKNGTKPKGIPVDSASISLPKPVGAEIRPKRLVFSLETSWGKLRSLVKPGGDVSQGQLLAVDDKGVAPPLFAPCAGKLSGIRPWVNFSGNEAPAIILQCSSQTNSAQMPKETRPWKEMDSHTLIRKVQKSGIKEPDPYRWPLAWRLAQPGTPPSETTDGPDISHPIDYLVINALDRQPGISIRESILSSKESEIGDSISLLQQVSGAKNTVLAIRKGQPISHSLQTELANRAIKIKECPFIYPLASEPLIVRFVTGREVPMPEGDSRAVGVTVVDVVTALRLYKSIRDNVPATSTLVQLSIPSSNVDYQVWVPEGILVGELLDHLQLMPSDAAKLVMGGSFQGFAQHTFEVPISGQVDSILVQTLSEVFTYENNPCISCGYCVKVCPMGLLPNELSRYCEYENFEAAEKAFIFHCIECGICAYVCPAKRPMVHLIRFGKREILRMREAAQ
ncbi:MAG: hypothetical protein DRH12_01005 [Deltaproteobacteria bacterium]|nr:MAG: hypothetical protein DRH12_01005 [Deltaproteobacteria bacterium]